jgi:hypothetical protein
MYNRYPGSDSYRYPHKDRVYVLSHNWEPVLELEYVTPQYNTTFIFLHFKDAQRGKGKADLQRVFDRAYVTFGYIHIIIVSSYHMLKFQ